MKNSSMKNKVEPYVVAQRIRCARECAGFTRAQAAQFCGISEQQYAEAESGDYDINIDILSGCSILFGVGVTDFITGSSATLSSYDISEAGEGKTIQLSDGRAYECLATNFRGKLALPYIMVLPEASANQTETTLSACPGEQKIIFVISGSLAANIAGKKEIIDEGGLLMLDCGTPHALTSAATGSCRLLVVAVDIRVPLRIS